MQPSGSTCRRLRPRRHDVPAPVIGLGAAAAAAPRRATGGRRRRRPPAPPRSLSWTPVRRCCDRLLAELAEHARRHRREASWPTSVETRSRGSDLDGYLVLAWALDDIAQGVHDAGAWWCRSPRLRPATARPDRTLRDATRELGRRCSRAFPTGDDHAIATVGAHRACRGSTRSRGRARADGDRGRRRTGGPGPHERYRRGRTGAGRTARAARALQQLELS